MGKRFGDNIQLFVKNGNAFAKPDGQGNLTINRSGTAIDTSDKNSGRYGSSAPGQQTLSITVAIQPNLPDAALSHMREKAAVLGATEEYQVRDISVADDADAVLFDAVMYTEFGNSDAPTKGVGATTVTLTLAAAPTKDLF